MEYLLIVCTTIIVWQGVDLYKVYKLEKRKNQLTANINARLSQIDKHLETQSRLLECFVDTLDKSYLDYGDEELNKAMQLIELNNIDLQAIRRL